MKKTYKVTLMMEDNYSFDVYVEASNKKEAAQLAKSEGVRVVKVTC